MTTISTKSKKSKTTDLAKHSLSATLSKKDRWSITSDKRLSIDTSFNYIFNEYWNKFCTDPFPIINVLQSESQTGDFTSSLTNPRTRNSSRRSRIRKSVTDGQSELVVVYDNYEQQTDLKGLIFKNLKANRNTIIALRKTLKKFETLKILKLEFCNLQNTDLRILKNVLLQNESIQTLSISGNPNPFQNFYILIKNTRLSQICLRLCHINDRGVELISRQLKTYHHPLLFLDLSSNFISDQGIIPICEALRLNRSLLSLNLADNWITEVGCIAIIRVLEKFPLMYSEFVIRRQRIMELYKERVNELAVKKSLLSTPSVTSRKTSQDSKRNKSKASASPSVSSKKDSINIRRSYDRIIPETLEYVTTNDRHPFIKDCFVENNHIMCMGNLTLLNLNLSYNKISTDAFQDILDMLLYQKRVGRGTAGITSFLIEGNQVEEDCKEINYINCLQPDLQSTNFSNISLRSKSSLKKRRSTSNRIRSANL